MERWQRIERLFLAATELPPAERDAFVDRESAGDADLHAAVQGMLLHADDSDSRIVDAVGQTAAAAVATGPHLTHIDRYTIVRELGHGGMGTVYLAERTDPEFHHQVAIKVVKRGMDTALIIERFRQERRILASLDHPNIARLFDGGATESGLPYLVMEYIDGQPLVDFCRGRSLPVRERLQLFEQVCAAVQHAHQKLIVHRDIKPANILVTPAGIPKLLDFGIAKLLLPDESQTPGEEALTRPGARMLTPDYASPEQIRGEPVSVAADVFSLGAVLYELLAGKRAHQFKAYAEAEFVRVICDTEIAPPSHVAEDARVRRELSGDLDNVVSLALRKDPARRYASVEQFAGDIRRFLEGRPVAARPESLLYRTRKFIARNRIPVAAAALAVVSLIAGIVGTTIQARRADAQAAQAERRFQQVRKLANTFVFDLYDGLTEIPGTAKIRAQTITTALEYLDGLARDAEGDRALQSELAAAYKRIGDVLGNPSRSGLGQMEASLSSYEKALSILRRLAEDPNTDPKILADLGILERTLGFVRLSNGDPVRGVEHQRNSVAAFERRSPRRGEDIEADTGIAQGWGMMGQALIELGESQAAVERHTAAVSLLREWLPRKTLPNTRGTLSLFLFDLAQGLRDTGDLRGAVEAYREALQIRKEIIEKDPTSLNYRRRRFMLNLELAAIFGHALRLNLGELATAEGHAVAALRDAEQMAKEDLGSDRSVRDLFWGNWYLGGVLMPESPRRAVPYLEAAVKLASARPEGIQSDLLHDDDEATAREALGCALLAAGDRARGLEVLSQAVDTFERISSRMPQIVGSRSDLIRSANALGDAMSGTRSADLYRKAYVAAQSFPPAARNVRELRSQAEVNLRWPRWNPGAPVAERRRKLEIAVQSWQRLASYAPNNRSIQNALAEARRSLAQAQ